MTTDTRIYDTTVTPCQPQTDAGTQESEAVKITDTFPAVRDD